MFYPKDRLNFRAMESILFFGAFACGRAGLHSAARVALGGPRHSAGMPFHMGKEES
jgi:hypothetical protein